MATRIFKGGEDKYCSTVELAGELANGWSVQDPNAPEPEEVSSESTEAEGSEEGSESDEDENSSEAESSTDDEGGAEASTEAEGSEEGSESDEDENSSEAESSTDDEGGAEASTEAEGSEEAVSIDDSPVFSSMSDAALIELLEQAEVEVPEGTDREGLIQLAEDNLKVTPEGED